VKRSEITIFLDQDGVLADFDGRVEKDQTSQALKAKWQKVAEKHGRPDLALLKKDDLKKVFAGPQTDPGMIEMKKAWNAYSNYTFSLAQKEGFFRNLEEMPGAVELAELAFQLTGNKPHILTAPIESNPKCKDEKEEWVKVHLPGLYDKFICTKDKHLHASPNAILIDDRPKYVKPFEEAGGHVVFYKNFKQAASDLKKLVAELISSSSSKEEESLLEDAITEMVKLEFASFSENVLDKMGKKKVASSMRKGSVTGPVYTEFPSSKEKKVVKQVSKNLHRKPFSDHPPMMGISHNKGKKK